MIWFDVDTALSEVPVNVCPLTDDTDFKTIEASVAYNAAGMALTWHFVTTAGAHTSTSVTPTTAGAHDWNHQAQGMYTLEIPSSGGTINNDTEGFGYFTGFATGVLPWRGPTIGFRAAALNNALVDGGDNLDVNVVQWLGTGPQTPATAGVPHVNAVAVGGTTQTARDLGASVLLSSGTGTGQVQLSGGNITQVTNVGNATLASGQLPGNFAATKIDAGGNITQVTTLTGHTAQTGDSFARIGATGSGLTTLATATSIAALNDITAADVWAAATRVLTANTNLNDPTSAAIASQVRTELAVELARITGNVALESSLQTVDGVADAIKVQTDKLTFTVANQVDSNVQFVNDVEITGNGTLGNEWGP